jgi:mannose-6-phosphate isomerase class I
MALHRVDLHNGAMNDAQPIRPHLVARVWGGERLRALLGDTVSSGATSGPIGEAWFGAAHGDATHALVKLLDVRERLSVQVHPNDALARELHGAGEIGKHEAWVIVEAVPDATILLGRDPAVAPERLAAALRGDGAIEPLLARVPVQPGDVIDVPPGLLHALMPGLLVWEIQQPTDRTYRVADWGRDAEDRPLHRLEAAQATDLGAVAQRLPRLPDVPGVHTLIDAGALSVVAAVGPWSGSIESQQGAVATYLPSPSGDALSTDHVYSAECGGSTLPSFNSARLGGGRVAVAVPAGGTLLIGSLRAERVHGVRG